MRKHGGATFSSWATPASTRSSVTSWKVVQHEHDRLVPVADRTVEERGQLTGEPRGRERWRRACQSGIERHEHALPEAFRRVVLLVERQPDGARGRRAGLDPRAKQRGLARPGRGRDERQPAAVDRRREALEQSRARDDAAPPTRSGSSFAAGML